MPDIKSLNQFREQLEKEFQQFGIDTNGLKSKVLVSAVCSLALDYADGFYRDVAGLVARSRGG